MKTYSPTAILPTLLLISAAFLGGCFTKDVYPAQSTDASNALATASLENHLSVANLTHEPQVDGSLLIHGTVLNTGTEPVPGAVITLTGTDASGATIAQERQRLDTPLAPGGHVTFTIRMATDPDAKPLRYEATATAS